MRNSDVEVVSTKDLSGLMIGYQAGVNRIVIVTKDGEKLRRNLAVKGLNILRAPGESGCNFSYYNYDDGQLHIINMKYVDKIQLYRDKELVGEIVE
ncbi:MAG: hypothetical protein J6T15_04685 [Bacilli bacterium]|nr:hypothetical protein [Bacilli bacterium]